MHSTRSRASARLVRCLIADIYWQKRAEGTHGGLAVWSSGREESADSILTHSPALPPPALFLLARSTSVSSSYRRHSARLPRPRPSRPSSFHHTSPLYLSSRLGSSSLTSLLLPFPGLLFRHVSRRASSSSCSFFFLSTITRETSASRARMSRDFSQTLPLCPRSLSPSPPPLSPPSSSLHAVRLSRSCSLFFLLFPLPFSSFFLVCPSTLLLLFSLAR